MNNMKPCKKNHSCKFYHGLHRVRKNKNININDCKNHLKEKSHFCIYPLSICPYRTLKFHDYVKHPCCISNCNKRCGPSNYHYCSPNCSVYDDEHRLNYSHSPSMVVVIDNNYEEEREEEGEEREEEGEDEEYVEYEEDDYDNLSTDGHIDNEDYQHVDYERKYSNDMEDVYNQDSVNSNSSEEPEIDINVLNEQFYISDMIEYNNKITRRIRPPQTQTRTPPPPPPPRTKCNTCSKYALHSCNFCKNPCCYTCTVGKLCITCDNKIIKCLICTQEISREDMNKNNKVFNKKCKCITAYYHNRCIGRWYSGNSKCPTCGVPK